MVAKLRGQILVLSLILLLFLPLAAQAEPSRVVAAEEILKKIELGQPVEYHGVTIVGDLDARLLDLQVVRIDEALQGAVYVGGSSSVRAKIVESPLRITDSKIAGVFDFNHIIFKNITNFRGTTFESPAIMSLSRFNQDSSFSSARFNQEAKFDGVQFYETVDFTGADFNQTAIFTFAQFSQTAFFIRTHFNQKADFAHAQFNQTGFFIETLFYQDAKYLATRFNHDATFSDARILNANFDYSHFSKDVSFDNAQINGTLSLYRTKYDKLNIRWSSIHELSYDDTAYYLLIENFKKQGFTDDASECYYSYRCKHREELFRQGEFAKGFFDLLAWMTNGYGLRPVRPLGWSVLFILLGGAFFFVTKSISRSKGPETPGKRLHAIRGKDSPPRAGEVSIWEALLLSATYFTSGASSIISSVPEEFSPLGRSRYVVVILRLLGWIFFVLFLTSLGKIA
jgi:hypothetical protein